MNQGEKPSETITPGRRPAPGAGAEPARALVHALQAHQVELEIQNQELRHAQVELARARDRYADLYEFAPIGYLTLDRDGAIVEANLAAAALLEVDRRKLTGRRITDFISRESQDAFHLHRMALAASDARQVCEVAMTRGDGTSLVARVTSARQAAGHDGKDACLTALIDISASRLAEQELRQLNADLDRRVDDRTIELMRAIADLQKGISARKAIEESLRESEARFRDVFEHAATGIAITDPRGRLQQCNPAYCAILGRDAEELRSTDVTSLVHPDDRESHRAGIQRLRAGTLPYFEAEHRCVHRDGRTVWTRQFVSMLPDEAGRPTHLLMLVTDITERRAAEAHLQLAERLASIGTLAAGLGHDMNNLLLPMRARLEIVSNASLPAELRRHVDEVLKAVRYMQDLADGLHLLAMSPDGADAPASLTDVADWWARTSTLLRQAVPRAVSFTEAIAPNLPRIAVSPHRLTQAILNLLINARHAVGDDGRIEFRAERSAGTAVRLIVSDNGCGMTPEVARRALDPFFTTKTRGLGTGLGLTLVQGAASSAGGSVKIDSAPGAGTTVTLTLPAVHPGGTDGRRRRALVSVRDVRLRSLAGHLLEAAGLEVEFGEAKPPPDALVWVTDPRPDVAAVTCDPDRWPGHAIVLGTSAAGSPGPRCTVVDDPSKFNQLRGAITQAARRVRS